MGLPRVTRHWAWASLPALVMASCTPSPRVDEREVVIYSPLACPIAQDQAFSVVYGNGDFENAAVSSFFLRDQGTTMSDLPPSTRSLIVDVSQPPSAIDWRGFAEVPPSGPVHVLVWPGRETCRLTRDVERRADMAIGTFGTNFLVVGGRSLAGSQVPHTFVGDLSTGIIVELPIGLGTRRAKPSVTSFPMIAGDAPAALVAGGRNPDTGAPLANAEVYVPKAGGSGAVGDFEAARIELNQARADHGAVTLATGETLLVGGVGDRGETLATMEIIDPKTRRARSNGVAILAVARSNPTVLRLATNEILVAGGFDAQGQPVPTLEWFSPDASNQSKKRPIDLVTGRERAFVALEAGGALAVIAPKDNNPDFKTVWIISADGTLEPAIPIDPSALTVVRLFEGAAGAPVLWTGPTHGWLRWDPWFGAFQPAIDAPANGPAVDDNGTTNPSDATMNGDSGLALWLEDRKEAGMNVTGWRFATRTRFDSIPSPLLVGSPLGLAPDRPAGLAGSSIHFRPGVGLELGPGASAFLTDVTLADFSAEIDVVGGAPEIVLRPETGAELSVGGAQCAFGAAATTKLAIERKGRRIAVRADDREPQDCSALLEDGVRIRLGLRGAQGGNVASGAKNLRVLRR